MRKDTESNEEKVAASPPKFPEGGSKAWLVVAGAWCTSFASYGIVNAFGAYETYYLSGPLSTRSPSTIAWIGSIQSFAVLCAALIGGPMADRYGATRVLVPSSVLLVIAMMLTSVCHEYYQFLLCQGILVGTCSGLIFTPALSVVGHYFLSKRALAMSLATTGSPVGGIIYPIMLTRLIPSIGFPWAQRVCAFTTLVLLGFAVIAIRQSGMKRKGSILLLEAFTKPVYSVQVVALFLLLLGLWTPYFYLADYALEQGVDLGIYLFAIINAGSFFGRLAAGFLLRLTGVYNLMCIAAFVTGLLLFCWLAITSYVGLVVFAILYGATSGIIIALMAATFAYTADHPSKIGTYIGQASFVISFAALAGTPITGALIGDNYDRCIIFSGAVVMAGAVAFFIARWFYAKDKFIA